MTTKTKKLLCLVMAVCIVIGLCSIAFAEQSESLQNKISPELQEKLASLEDEDSIPVYIVLYDVEYDKVMEEFERRYPEEYGVYIYAKEGDIAEPLRNCYKPGIDFKDESLLVDYKDPIDDKVLQSAIEHKREIYREAYNEWNGSFAEKQLPSEGISFISEYSPIIIASLEKRQIETILEDTKVCYLELYKEMTTTSQMSTANNTTNVTFVRDSLGLKGNGVKIGMIEANGEVPDTTHSELSSANITCYPTNTVVTNHATCMAIALVGATQGAAPQASLYCIGSGCNGFFFPPVEWLLTQGSNVINCSMSINTFLGESMQTGTYDLICKWVDHIAINHDVHFVQAAGNITNGNSYIICPGMAYNAITVGGYFTNNSTNPANYTLYSDSAYEESSSSTRPEKPNLIAPAATTSSSPLYFNGNLTDSGTSLSACQVTGAIAQLCSQASGLKTKQTAMGAILEASSHLKIQGEHGTGIRGDDFATSVKITNQIGEKEGAGKLDVRNARNIVNFGNYWGVYVNTADFPYTKEVYIDASQNTLMRVSIFWLMRNFMSGSSNNHANNYTTFSSTGYFDDLDLNVYDPSGTLVASSHSGKSNFEIAQFVPLTTGLYKIEVKIYGTAQNTVESMGIALW